MVCIFCLTNTENIKINCDRTHTSLCSQILGTVLNLATEMCNTYPRHEDMLALSEALYLKRTGHVVTYWVR
jgi:hypothetical protein